MADVIDNEELIATRRLNGVDDNLYEEEKEAIEVEKEIAEKFKRLYLKDFNNEKITDKDRLSYLECALLSDFIEKLQKENEELKEIYRSEKKMKNEYVKLYQDLSLKENLIPVEKVKDKIEEEIKYHEKNILDIENITMLKSKTAKEEAEIEFNKYAIVVLNKILQELIKESEEK